MSNSINTLSPSFRDYLLLKNLVTDTVVDNGLQSLLSGIGFPAQTETLPNAVQPSNSIDNTYQVYQGYNTIVNQYQGGPDDYTKVNIIYNSSINSTVGPYNNNNDLLNEDFYSNGVLTNSETIRKELTLKNIYVDVPKQLTIDLNTQAVPTYQNLSSYLDENNNLNIGGPSTNAIDIIAGVVTGQGVGFDLTGGGLIANEDIRSTLLGRVLGATGVINDTPLGNIGGQQLLAHVGYNASFGLQQETLGNLNLNPLNLLQGAPLVNLNYSITVPKNSVGKVLNFASNILGVQSPVSLLQSSIFSFDDKGIFIGVENIKMGNEIIKNSGKGQVNSLFNNLRANTRIANPNGTNLRQGYAPGYTDDRKAGGQNVGDGLNPKLYSRDDGNGELIDFINGARNSPISSTNYELSSQINIDGWDKDYFRRVDYNSQKHGAFLYKDSWGWGDLYYNTDSNIALNGDSDELFEGDEKNKKTLLYKTQQLFNSDNMRTLVTGHGVISPSPTQINSAVSSVGKYTSKGSGVLSRNAILTGVDDGPENVFCRTWTTYDRYAQVGDLQKHRELDGSYLGSDNKPVYRGNIGASVLQDNGFVKIAPISKRLVDNTKFMFSIENLAWADNEFNLLPCERGPGDGNLKGRIMWFPPYDITFSETTTASWDKHNFIGRGEPMYTYNNTERSGSLSWKIIIDHPNYMNFISSKTKQQGGNFDDLLASYFAGCVDYRDLDDLITTDEKDKTEVVNTQKKPEVVITKEIPPPSFDVYFPNDVYDIDKYPDYEDGLSGSTSGETIDYQLYVNGQGFGIGDYNEMCYKYPKDGKEVWSSVASSPNCKESDGKTGRLEPDRTDFGLNASGGSPNATFFIPVTLDGKIYKSWRDPEYHKDLQNYLLTKCKSCKVVVTGYASSVGTNPKNRNDKLSTLRADNIKDWLKKNVLTDPPFNDRVGIASSGEGISTARGTCPEPSKKRTKNYELSKNDVIGCKANRYVTVKFVIDENLIPKNEAGIEKESKNDEPIKTPAISTSRFYTECDYFEKLEQSSPVVYNSIKEQIKYFQPAFHSTTPEGFNARLTFLQQCMRQGPTNGAGSNNNPDNLAFGRPPVCILRIGDFYHTKIVIENLSFSFEPLVWDLNPEGIGVQPMICNVDMSFSFIGGSSLNGPINRLQNAVSFNYYANNEIYDPRPDKIEISENITKIVDGEKDITGEKNKAPLSQDTAGLTNKVEPVKDQVKEEVVANSGTENTQPLTSGTTNNENSEPVETPVEKVKKYPGFDENSGTYTTENAHKIKDILTLVIPKGTKIYTSDKQITSNFSLFDNYETYDNKRYITVSQVMNPNDKKTPNNIYYNKIEFNCKFKQFLVYETPLNIDYGDGVPLKKARIYSENNNSLSNVLSDIFCKTDKTKTFNEIKKFDNTK